MPTYSVIAIPPERHPEYCAYFKRGETTNIKGEPIDTSNLSLTVIIKARNKVDAESLVRQQYPSYLIDNDATDLHG